MNLLPRSIPAKTIYYRVSHAEDRSPAVVAAFCRATRPGALGIPIGAFASIAPTARAEGVEPWAYVTLDQSRPDVIASNAARAAQLSRAIILNPEGGHSPETMRVHVAPVVRELLARGCTVVVSTNSGQIAGLVAALRPMLDERGLFIRLQAYDHNRGDDGSWARKQLDRLTAMMGGRGAAGLDVGALEGPTAERFAWYFTTVPRVVPGGCGVWYDSLSAHDKAVLAAWRPVTLAGFALVGALGLVIAIALTLWYIFGGR